MEVLGSKKVWSFVDGKQDAIQVSNHIVRAGPGHEVDSYFKLAMKVAELQFRNPEYVLLFRGQTLDYQTGKGNSLLKPSIFRLEGNRIPTERLLKARFEKLETAESLLVEAYARTGLLGTDKLKRQRVVRWAILQHYEVCASPLIDATQSLRVAASFASHVRDTEGFVEQGFVYVFGVPNISGAITASSEAGVEIVRLASACPPEAVRPHVQEGYLLGDYPEPASLEKQYHYNYYETDFGRRLIAKFRFVPEELWHSENYPPAPIKALYPSDKRDKLLALCADVKSQLGERLDPRAKDGPSPVLLPPICPAFGG